MQQQASSLAPILLFMIAFRWDVALTRLSSRPSACDGQASGWVSLLVTKDDPEVERNRQPLSSTLGLPTDSA